MQHFTSQNILMGCIILAALLVIYVLGKTCIGLGKAVAKAKKKTLPFLLLFTLHFSLFTGNSFAQANDPAPPPTHEAPAWLLNGNIILFAFLCFILALTIIVLYRVNMQLIRTLAPETGKQAAGAHAIAKAKKPSFLHRVYLRLVDSVPVAEEKDILMDHDYDGIRELDNNLPPWWKYGFYVTIVFAVFYMLIYHVSGTGKLQAEEYKDEVLLAEKQKEERMKSSAENITDENVVVLLDAEPVAKGKETFQKLCVACHRSDGGGQVGPNLTDEYWLHGGGIKNIFHTITYGVPNKGMISWQSQLSPKQIQQVASYIVTLKGTNPPGPKEPQGDKWVEENTQAGDSTKVALADSLKK